MLKEAKEYGNYLIVVVARDQTVQTVKHRAPRNGEDIRLRNIADLKLADKTRLGDINDPYLAIAEEKPDIIALGYDQRVFVDKLADVIDDNAQIVRLAPYMPETYKSSKLPNYRFS